MRHRTAPALALALARARAALSPAGPAPSDARAQSTPRDLKVRQDREAFLGSADWVYNDLDQGFRKAREQHKPLMVVFRCIPCEACARFDDDVARRDPVVRDLMDKFVCVRVPQANTIDLTRFQHDFDQSFAVHLLNPDGTVYGRFGTRSDRPEPEDMALEGLREAMAAALAMHADYARVKPSLAGKQVKPGGKYRTPLDYPGLAGKFAETLNYEGAVAKSCVHCRQIREAERLTFRDRGEPVPDAVLYPYPDPSRLGLTMDPKARAGVKAVAPGSPAAEAGVRPGDRVETLAGQPLISTADLQWVLHHTPDAAELPARIVRGGRPVEVTLRLPAGWRRGDISWRVTSWDLRRMALGGMRLDDLSDDDRARRGLPTDGLALRVGHVGEYGPHAVAKQAGFRVGDVIVAFDGKTGRLTESDLLAHGVQRHKRGDTVSVTVLRDASKKELTLKLQ